MHVSTKKLAVGGLMLALTVVCITLGSVFESNTLFLLAAASYFVGIAVQEMGARGGLAFYLAGILLGFLLAPNKFYVCTYGAMGFYILAVELAGSRWPAFKTGGGRLRFWLFKYLLFNLIFVPGVLLFQRLLFGREIAGIWLALVLAAGQAVLAVYDRAYLYVIDEIWKKMRGRLLG